MGNQPLKVLERLGWPGTEMYQPRRCSFLSRPPPLAAGAEQGGWALWEARSPWPRETRGVCGGKGLELSLDLILQVRPGTKCASAQVGLG